LGDWQPDNWAAAIDLVGGVEELMVDREPDDWAAAIDLVGGVEELLVDVWYEGPRVVDKLVAESDVIEDG
jgi:hypothetical protein